MFYGALACTSFTMPAYRLVFPTCTSTRQPGFIFSRYSSGILQVRVLGRYNGTITSAKRVVVGGGISQVFCAFSMKNGERYGQSGNAFFMKENACRKIIFQQAFFLIDRFYSGSNGVYQFNIRFRFICQFHLAAVLSYYS